MFKLTRWLCRLRTLFCILLLLPCTELIAQQTVQHLNIGEVYRLAQQNYPLIKERDLITKTKDYSVSNAARGYLPALNINGQATYQSAVTSFPFTLPIKGFVLPTYSKDQYNIHGEVDQVIYDGGTIKNQKQTAKANEVVQQQNLEVELYALYDRLNQLFLGAMLVDEQLKQNELLKKDVQNGIDKEKAQLANGTAYRSSVDELQAQLLTTDQARVELNATRKAYLDMLGVFINKQLDENTVLEKPDAPPITDEVSRPELSYYDYQKQLYDLQEQMLKNQLLPKLNFYVQGGYARPGLDFLSNDFAWYYIGGLRLSWNLGSLYTLKNQRNILDLDRTTLDVQKETFMFNTRITQRQQNADVEKYLSLLKKDDDIIALRESVKTASAAQLENGVLSAHDFITEVNAADEAHQNRILHEVQLLQAQFSYQNTMGNIKTK